MKMLVFDRLGLPPLFWHAAVRSPDTNLSFDTSAFLSIDIMLASTLDEYSRLLCYPLFPLLSSLRLMQPDGGSMEPDATPADYYLLLRGAHRRPGVVRRSQAGGLASSIVDVCASLLKAKTCLNYVCTQIFLLPLTHLCIELLYSSPRGPWL